MESAMFIASVAGPIYVVMGLSLLFYPKPWQKLMSDFEKNHLTFMPIAIINMLIGLLIVNSYSVWDQSVWVLVTLTGWGALVKGVFYLLAPGDWTKSMIKTFNNSTWLMFGAVLSVVMGAFLSHAVYWA